MRRFIQSLRRHIRFVLAVFIIVMAGWVYYSTKAPDLSIKTYEECVAAGNPVMESFPERCRTQDGRILVAPRKVKIKGTIVCLPHKRKGPQTLECAYGLQSKEDGKYYGFVSSDSQRINMSQLPTGEVVVIEGNLREQTQSNYDIVGVIDVTSIQK